MEIFYSNNICGDEIRLPEGESGHCIRVLRHRIGDVVMVSGGDGNLYECSVVDDNPKEAILKILSVQGDFGSHPYYLHIAIAPTKNIDRFEWFLEKATEIGVDEITPLLCDHSERKVIKQDREERVIISAAKQSLKGKIPQLNEMETVSELLVRTAGYDMRGIAFCDRELVNSLGESASRVHITDVLKGILPADSHLRVLILIGPEGDFSRDELLAAADAGLTPISLGDARLRTETAGVLAVASAALVIR